MRKLVALAHRVFFTPGVQVSKNTLTAPVAEHHHQGKSPHHHGGDHKKHACVDTAQKQNAHGNDRNHHESAHVRFGQKQHPNNRNRNCHWNHRTKKSLFDFHLAHHVVRCIQKRCKLGQLGWLKVHDTQRNPAPCAVNALANERHQHHHQQYQGQHEQPGRHALPGRDRHLKSHHCTNHGDHQGNAMADHKMKLTVSCKFRVVRHGHRGRIHHDQTPHQQGNDDPHKCLVKTRKPDRSRGCRRQTLTAQTHRQRL